jgi:hypothetical protein
VHHFASILIVSLLQAGTPPQANDSASAYLDAGAAVLVAGARSTSDSANARITGYEALAKQRFTAGIRVIGRSRPVYRQEVAARIAWRRDGVRWVEVLGAREAIPIIRAGVSVDDDLASHGDDLVFDPTELLLLRIGTGTERDRDHEDDDEDGEVPEENDDFDVELIHPLSRGSEAHYRFRSGETTTIRLQDGRSIRLLELQVIPRRSSARLLNGSFWLEDESYAAVRGIFTLASPLRMSLPPEGSAAPLPTLDASFEIRHVAVEYALWEDEWWMPRLISFEGSGSVAGVTGSMLFEQTYEDFRVHSEDEELPLFEVPDTTVFFVDGDRCEAEEESCTERVVLIPRDTASLLYGPHLPASIYSDQGRLADDRLLRELAALVDASALRGLTSRSPSFDWTLGDVSLMRYNRVEGLTLGATVRAELEPFLATVSAWGGTADPTPSVRLMLARSRYSSRQSIELYRRMEAFAPEDRPFSLGSSFSSFLFGRDVGDYYRAMGAGITSNHSRGEATTYALHAFAETQRAVGSNTDASVPYWLDQREFRENPAADRADQFGFEARMITATGLDPAGLRLGLELGLLVEGGTYEFARASSIGYGSFPIPGPLVVALELSAGTSMGALPVQRLWSVGGPGTIRGFAPDERIVGESFWRARAEVGNERPVVRLIAFADAGTAATRRDLALDPALVSVGVGASTLDGLIRLDVAKALRGGTGWSLRLRLDGAL